MRERDVEEAFVNFAKHYGWLCFKWTGLVAGLPDRICFRQGEIVLAEIKRPGAKPRKKQRRVHALLEEHGFPVHIIDTPAKAEELLQR